METIHAAMLAILADIPAIEKSQRNKEQGYSFRGIDDVYAALHPLFVKHGVYVTPTLLDKEYVQEPRGRNQNVATDARVTVRYTFYASDGSHIDIVVPGESRDFADKATNQAMSTAIKTALLQTFLIPVDSDPDAASPTITRTTPKTTPKATADDVAHREAVAKQELVTIFGDVEKAKAWWKEHERLTVDEIVTLARDAAGFLPDTPPGDTDE